MPYYRNRGYLLPVVYKPKPASRVGPWPTEPTLYLPVTWGTLAWLYGMGQLALHPSFFTGTDAEIEEAINTLSEQFTERPLTLLELQEIICQPPEPEVWIRTWEYVENDGGVTFVAAGEWGENEDGDVGLQTTVLLAGGQRRAVMDARILWQQTAMVDIITIQGWYRPGDQEIERVSLYNGAELIATQNLGPGAGGRQAWALSWFEPDLELVQLHDLRITAMVVESDENPPPNGYFTVRSLTISGAGQRPIAPLPGGGGTGT